MRRACAKWKVALLLLAATAAWAQEPAIWRVLVEPKFMKAPVSAPLAGAKRAELVGAVLDETGLAYLSLAQLAGLKVDWEAFTARAQTNAAEDLKGVKVEYVRDRKKVIVYASVRVARGAVSSAVLAPGFLELFKETLGEKVLVVIPNRDVAFIFPGLASNYREYEPMVSEAYRATAFPVSKEVFELSREGIKAVGVYEEPGARP